MEGKIPLPDMTVDITNVTPPLGNAVSFFDVWDGLGEVEVEETGGALAREAGRLVHSLLFWFSILASKTVVD